MPWWRKAILLIIYGSMVVIGLPMAFAWLVVGGRGIIFAAGGFLALFGGYMIWTDFFNPKERL